MRKNLFQRSKRLASVLLGVTVAACAGDSLDPAGLSRSTPEVRSLYSSINGSLITMQDDFDGAYYTLDPSEKTITHSDGRILDLADDQNVEAMNAFYGNVAADQTVTDIDASCTPENPCADQSSLPLAEGQSGILLRKTGESTPSRRSAGNRFGMRVIGQVPQLMGRRQHGGITLMTGVNCGDLAGALRDAGNEYRYDRVNFAREGFWAAVFTVVGYKLRATLPVGGSAAMQFLGDIVINKEKRVSLTILGTLWNSYNCSNQQIRVGNFYQTGGGGGSGTPQLRCHSEVWEISIDGGNTWQNITVDVCEYAMQ